jgi:hypothetical protein
MGGLIPIPGQVRHVRSSLSHFKEDGREEAAVFHIFRE